MNDKSMTVEPPKQISIDVEPGGVSPNIATIEALRMQSLTGLLHAEIEAQILQGGLYPGQHINELELSKRFGVSRGPLREALRGLEHKGLTVQFKNRGFFVRDVTVAEAAEIYELRAIIDEAAVRKLAPRITPSQIAELTGLVDAMDTAVSHGDVDRYHPLNLHFHDRLIDMADNGKMLQTYRTLVGELALFRRRNLAGRETLAQSIAEHRDIIDAIRSGDCDAAALHIKSHALGSRARMLARERCGTTS